MKPINLVELVAEAMWDCEGLTASVAYVYLEESSKDCLRTRANNVLDKIAEISDYITISKKDGTQFTLADTLYRKILSCEKHLNDLNQSYTI